MRSICCALLLATAFSSAAASAQQSPAASAPTQQESPAFEVASVKPTDPNHLGSTFNFAPTVLQISGGTLRRIMEMAYDLRTFQILSGPKWLDTDRYDISANAPTLKDLSQEQRHTEMRRRLQTLLADRFQLKVHPEARELPEYALVVTKGGSRLKVPEPGQGDGISLDRCGVMKGTRTTMSNLAMVLSMQLARPIFDKTELTGRYDFEMNYAPDGGCGSRQPDSGTTAVAVPDSPSLFTAIQEQLGLKLESTKGPVEVIVIDRVEKPEPN